MFAPRQDQRCARSFYKFFLREKDGQQLIAALADLMAHLCKRNLTPEMSERLLPRARVQINRIDQRPVNVEDHGFRHQASSLRSSFVVQHMLSAGLAIDQDTGAAFVSLWYAVPSVRNANLLAGHSF